MREMPSLERRHWEDITDSHSLTLDQIVLDLDAVTVDRDSVLSRQLRELRFRWPTPSLGRPAEGEVTDEHRCRGG